MNLAFSPWIPCIRDDGSSCLASLADCLCGASLVDVAVRPHERVALMRLFLCVAYAACGIPENYDAWLTLRQRLPEAVTHYLKQWHDSFELFHPKKPFLQVAGLCSASKPKNGKKKTADDADVDGAGEGGQVAAAKLDFALAAGNNSTLFDHSGSDQARTFPHERLALGLLTYQNFSPGGQIGSVIWGDVITSRSSNDAPCAPLSMLHTFLRGHNLPESICLNMASVDELDAYTSLGTGWQGRPLWEMFPHGPKDKDAVHNATRTFLGRLVPLARTILLARDGRTMLLGNGLTFPSFTSSQNPFPAEFSATVITHKKRNKEEQTLLGIQSGRAIWRQLHALTVKRHNGVGGCIALAHCDDSDASLGADIVVDGFARDQAKIVDTVESVFHVPGIMLRDMGHATYEEEVKRAEEMERELGNAVETWRAVIDGGWALRLKIAGKDKNKVCIRLRALACRNYWTAVEHGLPLLFQTVAFLDTPDFRPKQLAWSKLLGRSAMQAYASACSQDNERQLRGFVAGKKFLWSRARKILEQPDKEGA